MGKEKTTLISLKNNLIIGLYDRYFHALMGIALHLTHNEMDAEELIANTFAKICQWKVDRLEKINSWDNSAAFSYLSNTLANTFIDKKRKRKNQKRLEEKYSESLNLKFENSPEATFLAKEKILKIRKAYYEALEEETKIVRVAFYLRTQRGLKNKEIANRLNQSPNTIGTQFRRLRIKIKEKLG